MQSDKEIGDKLRDLLAKGHRGKSRTDNTAGCGGCLVSVIAGAIAMGVVSESWGFSEGWAMAVAFVVFVAVFFGAFAATSPIDDRRAESAAAEFLGLFPRETGDYDRAIAMLRTAETKSNFEEDLLGALAGDVDLATNLPSAPISKETFTPPSKGGGLLGGLKGKKEPPPGPPEQAPARPKPDYIPLDPYDDKDGESRP